ncbi:S8 family serine peptidase, partial [Omnitrophica bacterium]|nr:S8 family serine peptidase [Candidatus Omnitrophota bacterium]
MYEDLQRNGKLRLIVKFRDFVSESISLKLGDADEVLNNDLNEYILSKIDEKYNLKKLKKLFKDSELAGSSGEFARRLDDYFVIEIGSDEEDAERICSMLEWYYEIDMVEPDVELSIVATPLPAVSYIPNDYYVTSGNGYWREGAWGQSYPNMWGLQKTQVFEAWDLFSDARTEPGKDIVVAVIDTGINYDHPDLIDNLWINPGEIPNNGVDDDGNGYVDDIYGWDFTDDGGGGTLVMGVAGDNNPYDGHGHGTHCSGTIAGVTNNARGVAGISPNTKIMAVKGLSDSGSGSTSWLANCVIYAANNGADVLSNSWGGWGTSSLLTDAFNYAYSRGCVSIAAAGNSNANVFEFMPANIASVIAVAATDYRDIKASFSNYGALIDVSAPGVSILSSTGGSYASWSGTSMACPHVAGISALILSQDPALTNAEVRQRLKDTSDDIYPQNPSWQGLLGAGRVNAYNAILAGGPQLHAPVLAPIGNKVLNEGELLSFTVSATDEEGDPLIYSVVDLPGDLVKSGDADFSVQSDTVYEGTRALQSGEIDTGSSSAVSKEIDLTLDGTLSFYWKVDSAQDNGYLSFYIDGVRRSRISGDVDWQESTFDVTSGPHTLMWEYSRNTAAVAGEDAGWIDKITIAYGTQVAYDFEDGQMPSGFITGGDGTFYVQNQTAYQGSYALMADPSIVDYEYEYIEKSVDAAGGAEVSFWWKVSSEYYYDFLEFYIDGMMRDAISGDTAWAYKTYTLDAGTHTLRWQYTKDYSVTRYQDSGWVDDIMINNGG